jgi:hypothetical protein
MPWDPEIYRNLSHRQAILWRTTGADKIEKCGEKNPSSKEGERWAQWARWEGKSTDNPEIQ